MLNKYKQTFIKSLVELKSLQRNPNDLSVLFNIQNVVLKKICYIEKKIKLLKKYTANDNKRRKYFKSKQGEYQFVLYLFKTICDGIAFIYYDKWDIKPLFYGNNYHVKPDSGNISGKTGLRFEFAVLKKLIGHGYPAILSDLTNVIRYGDVCVPSLKGMPSCIELKSRKNLMIFPQFFLRAFNFLSYLLNVHPKLRIYC